MKKIKNLVVLMIFIVASVFLVQGLCYEQNKTKTSAAPLGDAIQQYVSFSQNGQSLNYSNFNNFGDSTYIITNDSLTMTFNAFSYNYQITPSNIDNFIITYEEPIDLSSFEDGIFVYKNVTYYYLFDSRNNLQVFYNKPIATPGGAVNANITTEYNNLISYNSTENKINIISSYTLKSNAPNSTLNVRINFLNTIIGPSYNDYTINLTRPIINFKNIFI